jgi:putative membrane protein
MLFLYIKVFHLVAVIAWCAGLFYLPRIFVNLAQETNEVAYARLIGMASRLYKFMTVLAILAIFLGVSLYLQLYKVGVWLHAKLLFVVLICGYHHACKKLLHKFIHKQNKYSDTFYRWFNEIPVVLLLIITYLVIVKPF